MTDGKNQSDVPAETVGSSGAIFPEILGGARFRAPEE
jgi:hypothetical protein